MILDLNADVLPFLQLAVDDAYGNVARIQAECEQFVKTYCGRNFEQVAMMEILHHKTGASVFLKEYPVISVQKLAVGKTTALLVANSNTTTTAQVSVSTSGVSIAYNYGAPTTVLFSSYTTLSAIAAAIIAAGSGWSASVVAGFEQTLSSELIPQMSLECINNTSVELAVPKQALSNYHLNELTGEVSTGGLETRPYLDDDRGYPDFDLEHRHHHFIYANYTAGYSPIPADLKLGILALIKSVYEKANEGTLGVTMYRIEGLQKLLRDDMPGETGHILELYKRRRI
jgi:hypothetical protein